MIDKIHHVSYNLHEFKEEGITQLHTSPAIENYRLDAIIMAVLPGMSPRVQCAYRQPR